MNWSLRIARAFGIGIYIHWTFWLLIVWVLVMHLGSGHSALVALEGVGFVAAVFACVILHELGHALAARQFGIQTRDITVLPIGGVARLERMPEDPVQELVIALAGPAVNVAIAGLIALVLISTTGIVTGEPLMKAGGHFLSKLFYVNILLVVFNLIPAFPMDGGRVLRAILATSMSYTKATQISAGIGQAIAIGFGVLGLFFNPFLLLIALFVFLSAQSEAHSVGVRHAVAGLPVRAAMMTDFRILTPDEPVSEAVKVLLAGSQTEFPVLDTSGSPIGILTRDSIVRAVAEGKSETLVKDVMRSDCVTVHENNILEKVFVRMREQACPAVVVMGDKGPIGLLTLENIAELIMLKSAAQQAGG